MQKRIKILDCTLRDGGFQNNFNWKDNFVNEYISLTNKLPLNFIELGYWKQKNKSENKFYNLNLQRVEKYKKKSNKKISVMADFHYSTKNIYDFPQKKHGIVSLIRVTSRLEDFKDSVKFINQLKDFSKLKISLNIFNFSNYNNNEIIKICNYLKTHCNSDFLYFADTHGNLDFNTNNKKRNVIFRNVSKLKQNIGFHFHDNIGRAFSNYVYCKNNNYDLFDSTIFGIGRGGGNLRTEQIISKNYNLISEFIDKYKKELYVKENIYCFVTGKLGVSNLYANAAYNKKIDLKKFTFFCKKLSKYEKNNFNITTFNKIYE